MKLQDKCQSKFEVQNLHFVLGATLCMFSIIMSFYANSGPVQWGDNGRIILEASSGMQVFEKINAVIHPLYQTVNYSIFSACGSHCVPYFNSALSIFVVALTFSIIRNITGQTASSLYGAAAVSLSHSIFWASTKVEVYTLHLTLILALLSILIWMGKPSISNSQKKIGMVGLGLISGLALSTHQLTLLLALPFIPRLLQNYRILYIFIPCLLVGLTPIYINLYWGMGNEDSIFGALRALIFGAPCLGCGGAGQWDGKFFSFSTLLDNKPGIALLSSSFIGFALLGVLPVKRSNRVLFEMWCAAIINLIFALSYGVRDNFQFFICGTALFTIIGAIRFFTYSEKFKVFKKFIPVMTLLPVLTLAPLSIGMTSGLIPHPINPTPVPMRSDAGYFLNPYIRDTSAMDFSNAFLSSLPYGAFVLDEYVTSTALRAASLHGINHEFNFVNCEQLKDIFNTDVFIPRPSVIMPCQEIIAAHTRSTVIGDLFRRTQH